MAAVTRETRVAVDILDSFYAAHLLLYLSK